MESLASLGFPKYSIEESGEVFSHKVNRYLKQSMNNGYKVVCPNEKLQYVHRLMMQVFRPTEGMDRLTVNHIDGDRLNNTLDNLEWVERTSNIYHQHTENGGSSSLDEETVIEVCKLMQEGLRNIDICRYLGVTNNQITGIRTGGSWYRISKNYKIPMGKTINKKNKYSDESIHHVCKLLRDTDLPYYGIEKETGVCIATVSIIERRRRYKEIASQYDWPHRDNSEIKYRGY